LAAINCIEADLTTDGTVDFADFAICAQNWNTYNILPRMRKDDFNKDGITDVKDLEMLAGHWLDSGLWP
jgi:hypothetical protein